MSRLAALAFAGLLLPACSSGHNHGKSVPMMTGHAHEKASPTLPGAREIAVHARSFRFEPAELHVKAGEPVTIVLTSDDVLHDFTIGDGVHVGAEGGQTVRGGLKLDSPGTHVFYCTVPGHRAQGMEGKLIVDAAIVPIPTDGTSITTSSVTAPSEMPMGEHHG